MTRRPHPVPTSFAIRLAAASILISGAARAAPAPESNASMAPPAFAKPQSLVERKLDTPLRLLLAREHDRPPDGEARATGASPDPSSSDAVTVQITGTIAPDLVGAVEAAHGTVVEQSPRWGVMTATLPLAAIVAIAERSDVRRVRLPPRARTNGPATPSAR